MQSIYGKATRASRERPNMLESPPRLGDIGRETVLDPHPYGWLEVGAVHPLRSLRLGVQGSKARDSGV